MVRRLIKRDRYGNKLYMENGKLAVRNAEGKLVNKADSTRFLRKIGYKTIKKRRKIYAARRDNVFGI